MSPQDSLRHQLQKLTEDPSNTNNLLNSTDPDPDPPPYSFSTVNNPYTQSGPTLSRERMAELMSDIIYTDEPNPLTITVDASINIIGNNNSLALTSQPTASVSTPASASSSSASGSASTSTQPSEESLAREPRKKDREVRAAKLASVILKALQQADGLTDETGRKRTVSVLLKCGIRVEGCNNEIVADEDINKLISTCSLKVSSGGKKRGSSESPTIPPPPKRNCRIL